MNIHRLTSRFSLSIALSLLISTSSCGGTSPQDDINFGGTRDTPTPTPAGTVTPAPTREVGRVWTIAEVLAEPRAGGSGGEATCGGEFGFRRCVCPESVPGSMRYRPALAECNGNAAAILDGGYLNAFSIVVRDSQNRDRWPVSGFGGCSYELANSSSPPNNCSAFKVQDKFATAGGAAMVHCFGASGYSELFKDVVRVTIKLSDVPSSNADDIDRLCLVAGDKALN